MPHPGEKTPKRQRADAMEQYRCRHLIAVMKDPHDIRNIGTVFRSVCALGVDKADIVAPRKSLPTDWQQMRGRKFPSAMSASAITWSSVRRFDSTEECLRHLEKKGFVSVVTSPHVKGQNNVVPHEGDCTGHHRLAVWFGNESRGISDLAVKRRGTFVA